MKKNILLILTFCAVLIASAACSEGGSCDKPNTKSSIVDVWELTKVELNSPTLGKDLDIDAQKAQKAGMGYVRFTKDNKIELLAKPDQDAHKVLGTYSLTGDNLKVKLSDDAQFALIRPFLSEATFKVTKLCPLYLHLKASQTIEIPSGKDQKTAVEVEAKVEFTRYKKK